MNIVKNQVKSWLQERADRNEQRAFNECQYDDSNLSRAQRIGCTLRNNVSLTKRLLPAIAIYGATWAAGILGNANVKGLGVSDVNGDGIQDTVVIYPIKGTSKGLLGYLDGKNTPKLPQSGGRTYTLATSSGPAAVTSGADYKITALDFNPIGMQVVDQLYNQNLLSTLCYVGCHYPNNQLPAKTDAKGKDIVYLLCGDEYGSSIIGKVK